MAEDTGGRALADLRREIDRIDAAMHGLLMERGAIIDRLIAAKGTAASGSAFRPEREAAMTRVLVERHRGILPVEAVEGIWRVVISTFTHVQAPFRVHAGQHAGEAAMRDSARYHFGFTVPLEIHRDAAAVIAAVSASRGDLGLVPLDAPALPWWDALRDPDAPKVIARLPFGAGPAHPAGTPLLVVSRTISGEGLGAVVVHAARRRPDARALAALSAEILTESGKATLVAVPQAAVSDRLAQDLGAGELAVVGSYPEPIWREA